MIDEYVLERCGYILGDLLTDIKSKYKMGIFKENLSGVEYAFKLIRIYLDHINKFSGRNFSFDKRGYNVFVIEFNYENFLYSSIIKIQILNDIKFKVEKEDLIDKKTGEVIYDGDR